MLESIKNENILFLDTETVPAAPSFDDLNEDFKQLWEKKSSYFRKDTQSAADVYERAGIYAEFGKIICISVAHINYKDGEKYLRIKSFYGHDEKKILQNFTEMLKRFDTGEEKRLCAHNGKEFDFPYIARRILVNGLQLPDILNIPGKKPWEVKFLDTLELWKFGDHKHFTSLSLLTKIFNIPSPKEDMQGSDVAYIYWKDKDLNRIVQYCQRDVTAVAQLFMKYKGEDLIKEDNIKYINS